MQDERKKQIVLLGLISLVLAGAILFIYYEKTPEFPAFQALKIPDGIKLPKAKNALPAEKLALYGDYNPMLGKRHGPGAEIVVLYDGSLFSKETQKVITPKKLYNNLRSLTHEQGYVPLFIWIDKKAQGNHLKRVILYAINARIRDFRIGIAPESAESTPRFLYFEGCFLGDVLPHKDKSDTKPPQLKPVIRVSSNGLLYNGKSINNVKLASKLKALEGTSARSWKHAAILRGQLKKIILSFDDDTTVQQICDALALLNRFKVACTYFEMETKRGELHE